MIPNFAAILIYSLVLVLLMAKKDITWCPQKCGRHAHSGPCGGTGRRQVGNNDDYDGDDDEGHDWETKAPEYSGILGSIHRRVGRKDGRRAALLHAAEVRSHPNHAAAKAQLKADLKERYEEKYWKN